MVKDAQQRKVLTTKKVGGSKESKELASKPKHKGKDTAVGRSSQKKYPPISSGIFHAVVCTWHRKDELKYKKKIYRCLLEAEVIGICEANKKKKERTPFQTNQSNYEKPDTREVKTICQGTQ